MSALVLAPHCDDAALSLGAALAAGVLGGDVEVAVVFTRSRFTLAEPGGAPLEETSRLRLAEEVRAAALGGYRVSFLPCAEAGLRPGLADAAAVLDPRRDPRADPAWPCVEDALRWLIGRAAGPVLAPLGCTAHIDHRLVSLAARDALAADPGLPLLFYEELPYAATLRAAALARLLPPPGAHGSFVPRLLAGGSIEAKLRLLACFPSQVGEGVLHGVRRHWERVGAERVWRRIGDR